MKMRIPITVYQLDELGLYTNKPEKISIQIDYRSEYIQAIWKEMNLR